MRNFRVHRMLAVALVCWLSSLACDVRAQLFGGPRKPMTKPAALLNRQAKGVVNKDLAGVITQENSHVIVSLSKQRLFLMTGDQTYIDSPISSGKAGHTTPAGHLSVLEKDPNHKSSLYGNFVDRSGRIVRSGISARIDSAPSGTHYEGAPMKWFCRLTSGGVGFHIGILPGYPASHGCIRLPAEMAPLIYEKVRVGTSVTVER